MTKDEVKNLLGNPDRVSARQNQYDIREVWTYLQTSEEDKRKHTGLTIGTFGLFGALPVGATEHHYIVFSGDKMIGWDLPDPYAPDLIIEKRER